MKNKQADVLEPNGCPEILSQRRHASEFRIQPTNVPANKKPHPAEDGVFQSR
jgi:hypothetical protein